MTDYSKIEQTRLPLLKDFLLTKYGEDWHELEPETISLDLGIELSALLLDKIWVLKVMAFDKDLISDDIYFFAHTVQVINNKVADFDHMPISNSLEISYALIEILSIYTVPEWSTQIKEYVKHCLIEDGFGFVPKPLTVILGGEPLGDESEPLEDKINKMNAIRSYISEMMK